MLRITNIKKIEPSVGQPAEYSQRVENILYIVDEHGKEGPGSLRTALLDTQAIIQ
jgi:hypothetical protein